MESKKRGSSHKEPQTGTELVVMEAYDFKGKAPDTNQNEALVRIQPKASQNNSWMYNPKLTIMKALVPDVSYVRAPSHFPHSSHTQLFSLKDIA